MIFQWSVFMPGHVFLMVFSRMKFWNGMAVRQWNCICRNRWQAGFGPWAAVCPPLLHNTVITDVDSGIRHTWLPPFLARRPWGEQLTTLNSVFLWKWEESRGSVRKAALHGDFTSALFSTKKLHQEQFTFYLEALWWEREKKKKNQEPIWSRKWDLPLTLAASDSAAHLRPWAA